MTIDAGAASNFTTSSGALTLSGAGGLTLTAPSSQIDIDSSTLTIDTSSSISLDASSAASNFTVDSANLTLSTTTSGTLYLSSANNLELQAQPSQEIIVNNASNSSNFRVKTASSNHTLFVNSATNNIGIGTATPDSDRKLHVAGNVRIEGDLLINGNYNQIDTNTTTTEQWRVTNDGTGPATIIKQTGAQPIATFIDSDINSSTTPLGTIGNSNTQSSTITLSNTTDFGNIELESQIIFTISSTTYTTYVQSKTAPNQIIIDQSLAIPNGTSFTYKLPYHALFIKDTGLIGIGTSTPKTELEISGTKAIRIPVGTTAERPSGSNLLSGQIRYNSTNNSFEGYYASTWNTLGGLIDTDQDTFIQAETSPGADNDELKFFTSSSQRMIIDSSGNVGINQTSPSTTLDVNGNISFNEYLYHNGNTTTNIRFQSNQLTLTNNNQSKLNISTDITLDGGQTTDSDIGSIILKTAKNATDAILIQAQHSSGGITMSSNTFSLTSPNGISMSSNTAPVDIDAASLTIDTSSSISLDASSAASNFTVDSANLTLSTTTSGTLYLSSANNLELQAQPSQEIIINNASNSSNFRVKTANSNHTLFVNSTTNNIGIGTATPDSDRKLHVAGNVRIEGDLLVNGNFNQIDTNTSTTEQMKITNDGTGPAIIIKQTGNQPIATFIDSDLNSSTIPSGTIGNSNSQSSTITLSSTADFNNIELESQITFTISSTTIPHMCNQKHLQIK